MATVWEAALLGIIQGITAWLPVSSSGHLVLAQKMLGLGDEATLEFTLYMGSLFVAVFYCRNDIVAIATAFWKSSLYAVGLHPLERFDKEHAMMGALVAVGSIPAVFISAALQGLKTSLAIVGFGFMLTSLALWLSRTRPGTKEISYNDTLVMGTMQGVSVLPGISQIGTVVSTGLIRGISREMALRSAFLLTIPAMLCILALRLDGLGRPGLPESVGLLFSIIAGHFSIRLLVKIVKRGRIHYFSYYCFAIGLLITINFLR